MFITIFFTLLSIFVIVHAIITFFLVSFVVKLADKMKEDREEFGFIYSSEEKKPQIPEKGLVDIETPGPKSI